jgi:hypothetical protein
VKLPSHQLVHQQLGVTAIGLDPVLSGPGNLARPCHEALHTGRL